MHSRRSRVRRRLLAQPEATEATAPESGVPMDGTDQEPVDGRTHQASPPGEKPFPFPVWEESSGDENGLVIHSQVEEEEHKCAMCGKSFSQPLGLLRHQKQQHAGERAFMCPECGRGFSLKHNLIIHQRIHTGEKPFGCSICGKRFSLKQNLITHQRVHGSPARHPFTCPACRKHFREERLLAAHQKRDCKLQQEQQKQRQDSPGDQTGCIAEEVEDFARHHLRVKQQEKPPQTHAAFARQSSGEPLGGQSGHTSSPRTQQAKEEIPKAPKMRLRRGDPHFQCLMCGKTFSQKGNVAAHRRSHRERESLS
ncbi:zinc finger protein 84-like [Notechis scutatus]|uniref:Zinc finger protein 84-like n=1 Tax=Notechis scutatus TaxID=8663 RepID=A0A6J1VR76_9SAUR|nr:zinc finger protein 84-like [Notechis scutatus]